MNDAIKDFMLALCSKAPVPGGGGVSALTGAMGISLCSMVANLTSGKKKYAQYQEEIDTILSRTEASVLRLLALADADAKVFEPLSAAYGIPRDDPDRDALLEKALAAACSVPMEILREVSGMLDVVERLHVIGTKLAVSDVGVAASACRSAMESAAMNVYINTKLMKDRDFAEKTNREARSLLSGGAGRCDRVYGQITGELRDANADS